MRSDKAVNSSQTNKDLSCPYASGKLVHLAQKYILQLFSSLRVVLNLLLILHKFQARVLIKLFI